MRIELQRLAAGVLASAAFIGLARAEVVRVQIDSRAPIEGEFGAVGKYELIRGVFFGELDPADRRNAIIQDLARAPRNARGRVEYSSTFALAKPVEMGKASGFLFYAAANRGAMRLDGGPEGRIFLTSGWQGDIPPAANLQYATLPVARNRDGTAIVGPALARFVDMAAGAQSLPLRGGQAPGVPRPAPASLDTTLARLVRHATDGDAGTVIAATDFAFADCTATPFPGKPDPGQLCIRGGFDNRYAYDLTYQAKDPIVMGIGFAATRDIISFIRHAPDSAAAPNPVAGQVKWVIGTGVSQAGNFLRTLVNLGFTADEKNRKVFDGIHPQIASRQNALNIRFSVPGGASSDLYDAGNEGTASWTRYNDRVRGQGTHSLLDRCNASKTCPKVFDTFGASELWNLRNSINLVGADARADLPLPGNVRRYYFPGVTHGGGGGGFELLSMESRKPNGCLLPANPNPSRDSIRALNLALERWVATGREPPPSAYPTLARAELVTPTATGAPVIPGMPRTGTVYNRFLNYDFGPEYRRADVSGVMTRLPPSYDTRIATLVARVNADGNEEAGVPSVQLQVPLGTYLGWNVSTVGYYKGANCGFQGGFIPFARTRAERLSAGDPRLSIEERYADHAAFVAQVKAAADQLVARGFLLADDAQRIVGQAEDSKVLRP